MHKIRSLFHKIQTCCSRHSKGTFPWQTTAHPSRDYIQICDHSLICNSAERTTQGPGHRHCFCYNIQLHKASWKNYIISTSAACCYEFHRPCFSSPGIINSRKINNSIGSCSYENTNEKFEEQHSLMKLEDLRQRQCEGFNVKKGS